MKRNLIKNLIVLCIISVCFSNNIFAQSDIDITTINTKREYTPVPVPPLNKDSSVVDSATIVYIANNPDIELRPGLKLLKSLGYEHTDADWKIIEGRIENRHLIPREKIKAIEITPAELDRKEEAIRKIVRAYKNGLDGSQIDGNYPQSWYDEAYERYLNGR